MLNFQWNINYKFLTITSAIFCDYEHFQYLYKSFNFFYVSQIQQTFDNAFKIFAPNLSLLISEVIK